MVTTKNRLNGQANATEATATTSRHEGFRLVHVREAIINEAAEVYMGELLARLNKAYAKGLLNDLYAIGRVAGILSDFCESVDAGNTEFLTGSDLRHELHLKKLDLELGVCHNQ